MLEMGVVQSDLDRWNAFCLLSVLIASQRPESHQDTVHVHGHFYNNQICLQSFQLPLNKTYANIRIAA